MPPPDLEDRLLVIETKLNDEGISGSSYVQNVNTNYWNRTDLTLTNTFTTIPVKKAYFSYELLPKDKTNQFVLINTILASLDVNDSTNYRIFNLWCFASVTPWDTVADMTYINSTISNTVVFNENRLEFMAGNSVDGREHNYLVGYIEFG